MVRSKFKPKKIFQLWVEVLFYSILTYLIYCIFANGNFNVKEFFTTFLPIICQKYWFFTAYFLLYLIAPFLNKLILNSNKKELTILIIGLFILDYLSTRFNISSVTSINGGYCILWFIILYIIGAYFRLYPLNLKKIWIFIVYLVCTLSLWGMCYMSVNSIWTQLIYNSLDYTSPLVLIASVCLLLLFKDIKLKNKIMHKSICFISSCTFGVYLFHCSYIEGYLFFDILKIQNFYGSPYSALYVIAFALAIFAMGVAVECVRKFLVWIIKLIYKKIKEKRGNKKNLKNNNITSENLNEEVKAN